MKQTVLAKRYIEVLNLARDSPDALTLLNWTAPRFATKVTRGTAIWTDYRVVRYRSHRRCHSSWSASYQDAGDYGAVTFKVLQSRCPSVGKLTISDVNDVLGQLHATEGYALCRTWRNLGVAWLRRALLNLRPGYTRPEKRDVIRTFVTMATALENKWLVRIILKGATQIALRGGT